MTIKNEEAIEKIFLATIISLIRYYLEVCNNYQKRNKNYKIFMMQIYHEDQVLMNY